VLLPSLEANREAVIFLSAELNVTPSQFFSDTFNATWNRTPIQALTDSLVQKGMISYFYDNPEVEINSHTIGSYIEQINESSNLSALEEIRLQATGFSGYPAIPSPYIYHQFVGYDNSTTILIISTPSNLTLRQTDALGSVIQRALSGVGGSKYYIAGSSAMSNQLASQSLSGMFLALFIGIVLSIIIVGLYFRSVVAAFLPLFMFGVAAISATAVNALLYKYVFKSSVSFITPTLLLILLLGLSSDYSVYIISRFIGVRLRTFG
jgi:RND superfamily putative drug exporter